MEQELFKEVLKVCDVLQKHNVQYLIVGGTAVAYHGYYRHSVLPNGAVSDKHDIDIWFNPVLSNYNNLLNAIQELGIDTSELKSEVANPKKSFLRLEFENFNLDLLPEIIGIKSFRDVYNKRQIAKVDSVEIAIISFDDLVKSKGAVGRKKDMEDIVKLKSK